MANYTRNTLTGSLAPVNNELEKIELSLREKLDRNPITGQTNALLKDMDANSNRILNLPEPISDNEPIRRKDLASVLSLSIAEAVNNFEASGTSSIFYSGGGLLDASRISVLTDSSTYTLPLAGTLQANQYIMLEILDVNKEETPLVQVSAGDSITTFEGSDTEILFNGGISIILRLYSDGITGWRV